MHVSSNPQTKKENRGSFLWGKVHPLLYDRCTKGFDRFVLQRFEKVDRDFSTIRKWKVIENNVNTRYRWYRVERIVRAFLHRSDINLNGDAPSLWCVWSLKLLWVTRPTPCENLNLIVDFLQWCIRILKDALLVVLDIPVEKCIL